jgi:ADP-ribose pyrophosphatase
MRDLMMQDYGPWKIVMSHEIYRDPWLHVRKDDVIRPDGKAGTHGLVTLKPGVSVLAIDDERNVYLTEEFHYAIGRVNLEVVSGGREDSEEPLLAAQRELKEELGISASNWTDLGPVDPFTSVVLSPTRLFLAQSLMFGPTSHEGTELIKPYRCKFEKAVEMVLQGEVTHGPSCVLILKAAHALGYRPA